MTTKDDDNQLALSGFQRAGVIVKTTVAVGARKVKNKVDRTLARENAESLETERQAIAEMIFRALCQLRGTAMKIAQAISGEMELFEPEQISVLQQSQYQVPGLNPVLVNKVFRREFNNEPSAIFSEFESESFAAASLGQVHRGRLSSGAPVAVKVQYPGIDQTIAIDVGVARRLIKSLPRHSLLMNSLEQIEKRLVEEANYEIERQHAQTFKQLLTRSDLLIPRVYPEYSTRRVITYEFIEGQHIREWLAKSPSQEDRNRIGQSLWTLFRDSLLTHRLLHCDPNPGNFIVTREHRLALLDFGCVQVISENAARVFENFFKPLTPETEQRLVKLYEHLGAKPGLSNSNPTSNEQDSPSDDSASPLMNPSSRKIFFDTIIAPYKSWIDELTNGEWIDFSESRGRALNGRKVILSEAFNKTMQDFSPEFTLIHRTLLGTIQLLETIGAKVQL